MNKKIICKDIKGNEYAVPVEQLSFRPSVYGIIIQEGKILLSKQWDGYDFPGGGIKLGETIEQALLREVKEETGLMSYAFGNLLGS
jgi:8-oxo-dGTP pyrophosphatase MutT (NUDIX family)